MNQIVFSFTVFLAGILSFFSPCVFPLLPVYIGILLGSDQEKAIQLFGKKIRWHGLLKTLCFIAGISVISSSLVSVQACLVKSCTPTGSDT